MLIAKQTFSWIGIIGLIFVAIADKARKCFHKGDEIAKIYENATEEEKKEIYNNVIKYKK